MPSNSSKTLDETMATEIESLRWYSSFSFSCSYPLPSLLLPFSSNTLAQNPSPLLLPSLLPNTFFWYIFFVYLCSMELRFFCVFWWNTQQNHDLFLLFFYLMKDTTGLWFHCVFFNFQIPKWNCYSVVDLSRHTMKSWFCCVLCPNTQQAWFSCVFCFCFSLLLDKCNVFLFYFLS